MPPSPPGTGPNPRPSPAISQQIASSNATANAFLGGRQPSWMTPGAKLKKPIARSAARRPSAAHPVQPQPQPQPPPQPPPPQQQQQPAILPSPAPSDEPSPALSNVLDSPKTNPVSLADAPSMGPTSTSAPAPLPVTDARFVHILSDSPAGQDGPRPVNISPLVQADNRSPALAQQIQTLNTGIQDRQAGNNRNMSFDGTSPSPATRGPVPPLKRRRTDPPVSTPVACSSLLAVLDQYVQSFGGTQALDASVEKPRMMLLRDACKQEDEFFIVLHQLFCMWSLNPQDTYGCLPLNRATTDDAFAILESVLKKNQFFSPARQQWLSRFPVPAGQFSRGPIGGAKVVTDIASFLSALVGEYERLVTACIRRRYPLLVDELQGRLSCFSPVTQNVLFTSCRRRLGVPDDQLGVQMEQAFREDQSRHRISVTGPHAAVPVTSPGELELRNAPLINFYQLIVATAASRSSGQPNLQSPSISRAPSLQQGGSADQSPSIQHPQSPSIQHPQQHQAAPALYSMPNPFSPVYSSPAPLPSQLQTAAMPNTLGTSQRPTTTAPSPAQPQSRAVGNNAPIQQPQLPSQYLLQQQQALAQRQQLLSPQQFNQQQYQRNLQAVTIAPAQAGPQSRTHIPRSAAQTPLGVQPPPTMLPQQLPYNMWTHQISPVVTPRGPIANGMQLGPTQGAKLPAQQVPQDVAQRQRPGKVKDPLLPPQGVVIGRPDWPYDPADRKAILMSLHQAHVRSPKRVMKNGETERFYQAVKSLPVGPAPVVPKKTMYEFRFEVTEEQFSLAATQSTASNGLLSVVEHFSGSLRWRIRCCAVPGSLKTPNETQWVTLDVSWPSYIHMTLNDKVLHVRRQPHNGKDLSTEITDFIVRGTNVLMIAIHDSHGEIHKNRHLAVEVLETLSHSNIVTAIWAKGPVPEEDTLSTIKKRLTSSVDDEVAFEAPDLSIDLADPFSATIFKTPARGIACTHMECFDLENWLNTRPAKPPPVKCPHRQVACTCPTSAEPSNPDKWRCPICSKDARPYSLRIDGFLLKVRAQLEAEGKLRARSMRVKADGSWSVVVEADDEDAGSDGEEGALRRKDTVKNRVAQAPVTVRKEVEVIEID